MAASSSRPPATPNPTSQDTRNYLNPGIFVGTWPNIFIVEEPMPPGLHRRDDIRSIPWDILTSIKMLSPDIGQEIVISGWDGVRDILQRLERVIIMRTR